ncbi:MAG: hypothetical protein EXR75_02150 [Myxococcales bacterium]|nr:hypothetical protein [Myxococcales bacterium]
MLEISSLLTHAARALGITREGFHKKLRQLGE